MTNYFLILKRLFLLILNIFIYLFFFGNFVYVVFNWTASGILAKIIFFSSFVLIFLYFKILKTYPNLSNLSSLKTDTAHELSFVRNKNYKKIRTFLYFTNLGVEKKIKGYYSLTDTDPIEVTLTKTRIELRDETGSPIDWLDFNDIKELNPSRRIILIEDNTFWQFPLWLGSAHKKKITEELIRKIGLEKITETSYEHPSGRGMSDKPITRLIAYRRRK